MERSELESVVRSRENNVLLGSRPHGTTSSPPTPNSRMQMRGRTERAFGILGHDPAFLVPVPMFYYEGVGGCLFWRCGGFG